MARILVTGANGFIGRHLVARLVREGHFVLAMVRSLAKGADLVQDRVDLYVGDLSIPEMVAGAIENMDCVVNCAAKVSDWGDIKEFERSNIRAVANLIDAIQSHDADIHLVHLSTSDVYGFPNSRVNEACALRPLGINYVDTKIKAERLLQAARAQGLTMTIIRPTNVIGPNSTSYVDELLEAARTLKFVPDIARPEAFGGFLCVENLVEAIVLTLGNPAAFGETFNVCDEIPIRWTQYIQDLSSLAGMQLPAIRLPYGLIYRMASAAEGMGALYGKKSRPPLTKLTALIIGTEQNFSAQRIRSALNFAPVATYAQTMEDIAETFG